jgi:hypothetical protein
VTLQADASYAKSRVELENFELAAFAALRAFVPNFYKDGREDTLFGAHLRNVAVPMAQLDFRSHYNVHGSNPALLNSADLLRRFGGPLFLNRNYPGKTQYDLDFKAMVLKLLDAYRHGATTAAIEKVIEAFTGENYGVEELFKSIGTYYDVSDRHAIRIGVRVAQAQEGITTNIANDVARVRDLVVDLYDAIDLCKPAHVGINLTTVMGLDEDIAAKVAELTDELRIIMFLEEAESGEPMLHQGPFLDPNTPNTGLAPAILALSYQWLRDGVPIPLATGPDYVIPSASLSENNQKFSVRVTDPILGVIWSEQAVLKVSPTGTGVLPRAPKASAPLHEPTGTLKAVVQPVSHSVIEGAEVVFSVSVQNATQPGLLSPHLNRVWEIQSDELHGLDLD